MTDCSNCGHNKFDHQYEGSWDGEEEYIWVGACEVEGCNCDCFEW